MGAAVTPPFPDAAFRATRVFQRDLPLTLLEGAVPPGLAGHLFVLSPVGTVDSGGAPYPNGNDRPTVINGDGMVWRFDFSQPDGGLPTASSRIIEPPDYRWDELTKNGSPLAFAGFVDLGMLRASPLLGTRNFANTAFVPMPGKSPGDPTRLICAYDAGPPVELDPVSLETLGVVGTSWDAEALDGLVPFPPILSTAHPFYDAHTGELFSVNYGRSVASMLETIPLLTALSFLPDAVEDWVGRVLAALGRTPVGQKATKLLGKAVTGLVRAARRHTPPVARTAANDLDRLLPESFLDLVWWDGQGDITRIPVLDAETGKEAAVLESMHQVAVTKRFVLLLDTNFKLRLDQFYNNPFPYVPEVERLLRVALASRQGETSNLWVIERADVAKALSGQIRGVSAFKVRLPGAVHFLADYEDGDGIRIQCAHGTALDIAEWVRRDDLRLDGQTVREPLHGMIASEVDVSRLGAFVIDPVRRRLVESRVLSDDRLWGIGLYAARGVPAWDRPPDRLGRVFWFASGLWDDNYTLFIRSLYADYPSRLVPLAEVDALVRGDGRPTTIFAVDPERFELVDAWEFPAGLTMSSPQFIPDQSGDDAPGWVSAIVWDDQKTMLWIFAADALAKGPVAKLVVPAELGFSLHSAWLPEVRPVSRAVAAPPSARTLSEELLLRAARLEPRARRRLQRFLDKLGQAGPSGQPGRPGRPRGDGT